MGSQLVEYLLLQRRIFTLGSLSECCVSISEKAMTQMYVNIYQIATNDDIVQLVDRSIDGCCTTRQQVKGDSPQKMDNLGSMRM